MTQAVFYFINVAAAMQEAVQKQMLELGVNSTIELNGPQKFSKLILDGDPTRIPHACHHICGDPLFGRLFTQDH